jgi:AcrR family transcriptional regulator
MAHPAIPGGGSPVVGPWERKRVRASLEIERAGLELLAQRGLDEVTVEEVAAAAGISVRTFFRYFRNVPDLLTRAPQREAARIGRSVVARPAGERLTDCVRAALAFREEAGSRTDNADLEERNNARWGDIARADSEPVAALSQGLTVMVATLTEAIAARQSGPTVDGAAAAILGAAMGGVVWFVYLQSIRSGAPLTTLLDEALTRLSELV